MNFFKTMENNLANYNVGNALCRIRILDKTLVGGFLFNLSILVLFNESL